MADLKVGDKLDQYELTTLLAQSGMASIWKAADTITGRTFALKIPHFSFESDVVFCQRFEREEQIGKRLDHPAIVKVVDPVKKSRMYMAMEFVEGTSLRALIDRERRVPVEQALDIARKVCEALVYIHARGVIHRDLKPENVIITPSSDIKILDFGIAMDDSSRRLTWSGFSNTLGTPTYMAPEQINGRRGDVRTDIYSLGTILYEMVTGKVPYEAASMNALMRVKTTEPPTPPSRHAPEINPGLEDVILHAIERDPGHRYTAASVMLADLQNPADVVPRDRTRAVAGPGFWKRLPNSVRVGLVVTAVVVALLALIMQGSRRRPTPPTRLPGRVQSER